MTKIEAVIRVEKVDHVLAALAAAGFCGATHLDAMGRGSQGGVEVAGMHFEELPKALLIVIVPDSEKDRAVQLIIKAARTARSGAPGDGKIFVSRVDEVHTVSSGAVLSRACFRETQLSP